MAGNPTYYTGEDASITLRVPAYGATDYSHTTLAISDFTLTLSKGTVEQELVGEKGNYFIAGSFSAEGSLTACKVHNTALGPIVSGMIGGKSMQISGNCGTNSLHFYFASAMVTGFDFSIGTGDEITEGTIDFTLLYPYLVSSTQHLDDGGTYISDFGVRP